jgi:nucleoside-diphosphate-sugar epimerase
MVVVGISLAPTQFNDLECNHGLDLCQRNFWLMKILVTGGLGFIGHNVVSVLEHAGHDVVITDTRTTYDLIDQHQLDQLITERRQHIKTDRIYSIDIADHDGIAWLVRTHSPDVVIHLASFPRQKVVNANPQWGSRSMSEGLLNVLEASRRYSVKRFVYVSSSMVYGHFDVDSMDGITEYANCRPIGQYGIMKLAGEWLVQDYSRRECFEHVILRPSAVYGPRDIEDRVVSKFLLGALRGTTIQVHGDQEELDFTYIDDTAQGIAQAAVSKHTANQIYNISRGSARTLLEAAQIAVNLGQQGQIEVNLPNDNFPSRGQMNISSAHKDFGFNPETDIEQGFRIYYDWLKTRGKQS